MKFKGKALPQFCIDFQTNCNFPTSLTKEMRMWTETLKIQSFGTLGHPNKLVSNWSQNVIQKVNT